MARIQPQCRFAACVPQKTEDGEELTMTIVHTHSNEDLTRTWPDKGRKN